MAELLSRRIDVSFALVNGEFEGGGNTLTVRGLRVACHILNTGGPTAGQMELTIWGLTLSQMNQLVTTGAQYNRMYANNVQVFAGDDDNGTSLIWDGAIVTAQIDGQQMPAVCLRVVSQPGGFLTVQPATPLSIQGSADAGDMIKQIAGQIGYGYESNGVTAKLSNPYYAGSVWKQLYKIAHDAGFEMVVDRKTICALVPGTPRQGDAVLIAPPALGGNMIGYPNFDQTNIQVRALFDPAVSYYGTIQVLSEFQSACGLWMVNRLEYQLEARLPGGHWEMAIEGVTVGATVAG